MKYDTNPALPALARAGTIGIAVPRSLGGAGGDLADLFKAVARTARQSLAEAQILAVQRQFAEVLLTSENIGLAEYRLPDILDGSISGACTATWPVHASAPLTARETGMSWLVTGDTSAVPNVGEAWFLITALVQSGRESAPFLAILRSEDDGIVREPASSDVTGDDTAKIAAHNLFFRADEILQQDASRSFDHLRRFSGFLRCAIATGEAEQALESMETSASTDAGAELRRVVDGLIRPAMRSNRIPPAEDLRVASRTLRALRPQSASIAVESALSLRADRDALHDVTG